MVDYTYTVVRMYNGYIYTVCIIIDILHLLLSVDDYTSVMYLWYVVVAVVTSL